MLNSILFIFQNLDLILIRKNKNNCRKKDFYVKLEILTRTFNSKLFVLLLMETLYIHISQTFHGFSLIITNLAYNKQKYPPFYKNQEDLSKPGWWLLRILRILAWNCSYSVFSVHTLRMENGKKADFNSFFIEIHLFLSEAKNFSLSLFLIVREISEILTSGNFIPIKYNL